MLQISALALPILIAMAATALAAPPLTFWLQQLAGILPLSALIEFIDIPTKLHVFKLNGAVSLWNWPVTPAGARLLLSDKDSSDACCLDQVGGRSAVLHCIDGRYGDWYPSSAPATVRLCVAGRRVDVAVPNGSANMKAATARKQSLEVVHLTRAEKPKVRNWSKSCSLLGAFQRRLGLRSITYRLVSVIGWFCWVGVTTICLMAGFHIASAFLLIMPLTGILVRFIHGGQPRRLLDQRPSEIKRLVVATQSLNGTKWLVFYGESNMLNSLLNKPLYRVGTTPLVRLLRQLLRLMIVGQWILAIGSCALQDWDALIISFWIFFCAFMSTFAHPPQKSVHEWLQYDCNIVAENIQAEFSSRRSMLSAIVYLNPDSKEGRTDWMSPIIARCSARSEWESALLEVMNTGDCKDETMKEMYWWKYIIEGVEVGKQIKTILQGQNKDI